MTRSYRNGLPDTMWIYFRRLSSFCPKMLTERWVPVNVTVHETERFLLFPPDGRHGKGSRNKLYQSCPRQHYNFVHKWRVGLSLTRKCNILRQSVFPMP